MFMPILIGDELISTDSFNVIVAACVDAHAEIMQTSMEMPAGTAREPVLRLWRICEEIKVINETIAQSILSPGLREQSLTELPRSASAAIKSLSILTDG
jgi:hypothetical protein